MYFEKIPLKNTSIFSPFLLDYLSGKKELEKFYQYAPRLSSFKPSIKERYFPSEKREILVNSIWKQYKGLSCSESTTQSIESLKNEKTFTVTTGHQLNIFTGPLYFIYKLVSTINLAARLKKEYPEYNFVPIYWMASEDHDLEEVSYFWLFGKKYVWDTDQTGCVGRMKTSRLENMAEEIEKLPEPFKEAYSGSNTLAEATRYLVNELFAEKGLVILDPDDAQLKALFRGFIKSDITENRTHDLVKTCSSALASLGYKPQVFPREINFFYLKDEYRSRLIKNSTEYKTADDKHSWNETDLLHELEYYPERFSPNVVMRPLYQEVILPNLAYLGGPAEMAYWMQLKPVFNYYRVHFPILLPRNFALVMNKINAKKYRKTELKLQELFFPVQELITLYMKKHSQTEIILRDDKNKIKTAFSDLIDKASLVDASLRGFIGAEENKVLKVIDNIEKRLKKAEEHKHSQAIKQIESLKEKLFPGGILQERVDNLLSIYLNHPCFMEDLFNSFDPLDFQMVVLFEET